MLEAKPSRLSRAAQLGARKSPSERGRRAQADLASRSGGARGHRRAAARLREGVRRGEVACGAEAAVPEPELSSPAEPTLDSCRERNASAAPAPPCALARLDPGQNLSSPSPPPQITKSVVFITYFASCACFQVYTVLQLE